MDPKKLQFVKEEFVSLIRKIDPIAAPAWGVMNAQQMIEHMSDAFRVANGKVKEKIGTPVENIPKMKAFIMRDIPFKENTKNRNLPDEPAPLKNDSIQRAIEELQEEVNDFFNVFEKEPGKIIDNAIFGDLNYTEWVHLLYKHCVHHLKQFRLVNN